MTNTIAIVLIALIAGVLLLDAQVLHWNLPLVVAREFVRLVEWLSFWR